MKADGRWSATAFLLATALALPAASHAQAASAPAPAIYSCTDANGRVISADRPLAACADRELRVHNPDGSLRRIIEPPLSKEQRAQREAEEKRRRDEAWARKVQQARDRNLLLTFEDEHSLESMRRRDIEHIDQEIKLATQRILTLDRELKAAQEAAETWKNGNPGKPLPFSYQQRITETANAILAEDALIADRRSERERVNSRFDADARRLRELLGKPAAQNGGDAASPRS
jgi:hypothetical protein